MAGEPRLDHQERGDQERPGQQWTEDPWRSPAVRGVLGDAVDGGHQAESDGHRAGQVEAAALRARPARAGLRDHPADGGEQHEADRDVHQEDPAPGEPLDDHASGQHTDRARGSGDRAPPAECPCAGGRFGERRTEHGEGGRCHDRGAEPLEGAGEDQGERSVRGSPDEAGQREQTGTAREDPALAEQVREPPAEQQEAADDHRVGVVHELQVVLGEVQVRGDDGQGHVHHRGVQHVHELAQAAGGQHEGEPIAGDPPAGLGGRLPGPFGHSHGRHAAPDRSTGGSDPVEPAQAVESSSTAIAGRLATVRAVPPHGWPIFH